MVSNAGKITTLAASPTTGIIDGTDALHTGLFKAIECFTKDRICIAHGGFTLTDAGNYTRYSLVNPKYKYEGKFYSHSGTLTVDQTSLHTSNGTYSRYLWVLLNWNSGGTPTIVLDIDTGIYSSPRIKDISDGYIPIALVNIAAGSDDDATDRVFQMFTQNVVQGSVSIGYDSSGFTEKGALTASSAGLTITGTTATIVTTPFMSLGNGATNAGEFRLLEDTDNGAHYTGFKAPAAVTSNSVYTMPAAFPGADRTLQSDSSGVLSWVTGGGTITALNNQTANRLVTIGATTTELDGEANLTFDGSTLGLTGDQTISGSLTVDTNTLYVDNSGNEVGIGTTSPDRQLHVEILGSSATNSVVPALRLTEITSATPANGLGVGMEFEVESTASNNEIGATINAVVADNTGGNEDFNLIFNTMIGGATANERLRLGQDAAGVPSCVFNENGDDVDFRVEGDTNANMIVVDAGNNRVGFGNGPLNTIDFHGNQGNRILDVTSSSSAGWEDCRYIVGNDPGAPINLTLPNPGVAGRTYTFKNVNLQPIVISCVTVGGSDNIRKMDASLGGATYGTSFQVASGQTATLVYEVSSTNWVVFGHQDAI
jgi:hypothetical protein